MSRKSLKILLVLVTILSLISTFSLATDATPVTTSDEGQLISTDGNEAVEGDSTSEETTDTTTSGSSTADINNDLYLAESEVTISDTVNGNVFAFADTITVTGQIGGDLFAIASTINIDGGQIYGNVFAIANNITLNGLIYDLYATCDTLNVAYDGVAYRDLKVNCNTASINGVIGKNLNITTASALTLESDCVIYGDLNYTALNEIEIGEGVVTGTVNYEKLGTNGSEKGVMAYVLPLLALLVYTLVIWLLMSKLAPKFYEKVTTTTPKKMLLALLVGLLALIVIPIVSLLLVYTIVGLPIAFALMVVYGLILAISFVMTVIALAGKLANKVKVLAKLNNLFAVIIITLVLWALSLIPYVGIIVLFLVVLCGFGMFLMSIINKKDKAIEPKVEE